MAGNHSPSIKFESLKSQKTSTKIQINHNDISHNTCTELSRNIHSCFGHLIIDIWNLFVICYLLFGALFTKMLDFMYKHYIVTLLSSLKSLKSFLIS